MIKSFGVTEKELTEELGRCHSHIEDQDTYIQQLKEDNKYVGQLSEKIQELTKVINQVLSELEAVKDRNTKLEEEKVNLEKVLSDIEIKYSGKNGPQYLKEQINKQINYITELEVNTKALEETINELKGGILEHETNYAKESEVIFNELRELMEFMNIEFPSMKVQRSNTVSSFIGEIRERIRLIKSEVSKDFCRFERECEGMKKEIEEACRIRDNAVKEITQLKDLIHKKEYDVEKLKEENSTLCRQQLLLRNQLEQCKEDTNGYCTKVFDKMMGLMNKYEGVEFEEIKMTSQDNKQLSVIELISAFEVIADKLNNEIKNLNIKCLDLEEIEKNKEVHIKSIKNEHRTELMNLVEKLDINQQEVRFVLIIGKFIKEQIYRGTFYIKKRAIRV